MKILFLIFVLTTSLFAREKRVKLFPFKSAVITYQYKASFSGTHIKYIADYGYKQADYIRKTENFGGSASTEEETIILIGPKAYTINYQDSTVAVGRNATYDYYRQNPDRTCLEISEALLRDGQGWKASATENYLNKKCTVWKQGKNIKLTWKGLELKSILNFMTMMVEKAVQIDIDVDVPPYKFEIPQDLRYISGDVYQGYSGLKLNFKRTDRDTVADNKHIKFSFSSQSLGGCNNFAYLTASGEKIITKGVNDYNKIDRLIIESQKSVFADKAVELPPAATLIFKTNDNHLGKMQIKRIEKKSFQIRHVVFNADGTINTYSDGNAHALTNDFSISADDAHSKLIITPKNRARCSVLGW